MDSCSGRVIKCSEAVKGVLRGSKFARVLEKAKERGLISEENLKEEPLKKIRIHDLEASLIGKFVEVDGQIIGEKSGKAIPTKVKASCKKCGASIECELGLGENATLLEIYLFHKWGSRDGRIKGYLKPILDNTKPCESVGGHYKKDISLKYSHHTDYSIIYVRNLLENIKGERRAYKPRTAYLIGHRIPEAKEVKLTGKVVLNPNSGNIDIVADSIEPLETEVTSFEITEKDRENFPKYFNSRMGFTRRSPPTLLEGLGTSPNAGWFECSIPHPKSRIFTEGGLRESLIWLY